MIQKTGIEVRVEYLELARDAQAVRITVLERALWWALGAGTGIGSLVTLIASGVAKRLLA